jgi:uncharacterized protein (TIGR03086 family)
VSEIADRYRRLSADFAEKVAAVPADRWDAPSPCEGWTARDVVGHVASTPNMFFGFIGEDPADLPEDPAQAFEVARAKMQAALDDPAKAGSEFDGFFGRTTFEAAVDRFVNFDLVVHGWDLARATGLDATIPEDEVARLEVAAQDFGDSARAPGVFGPEVDVPEDADRQTKLLAFLGRKATSD